MSMNMDMSQDKPRVYWLRNQVYLRFPETVSLAAAASTSDIHREANKQVRDQITFLNNTVLKDSQLQIEYPLVQGTSTQGASNEARAQQAANNESLLDGVYLFPVLEPSTDAGPPPGPVAEIVGIFPIKPASEAGTMSAMPAMPATTDETLTVVNLINQANQHSPHPIIAIPNMLWSASSGTGSEGDQTHGCPVCPPMPVEEAAGQWHITLPAIPEALQNATGKSVTVLVLDTLPEKQQIEHAAKKAGNNNMLLQSLVEHAVFNYHRLSDHRAAHPEQLVTTGKDINGNLVGFPMPDHGMFVAGIVHDLAPAAKIECIRVLNNYGVGELKTLLAAFSDIQFRLSSSGDLHQQPVVINLSLLVMPPGNENSLPPEFNNDIQEKTRAELHRLLGMLMGNGAVIVASAGNDSDPRDTMMNPDGVRYWPRYPARFAYDTEFPLPDIIPVGAINGQGQPASYSNYPGPLGIATYGGEIPTIISQGNSSDIKVAMPPDALRGVYTSPHYPQLTKGKPMTPSPEIYPEYPAPNHYAWAYWSGTSFATSIISALVARSLENQQALKGRAVSEAISAGAPQIAWTHLEKAETMGNEPAGSTPMIQAVQSVQQVPQPEQAQSA